MSALPDRNAEYDSDAAVRAEADLRGDVPPATEDELFHAASINPGPPRAGRPYQGRRGCRVLRRPVRPGAGRAVRR
jgi:hypothetical protein